MLYQQPRFTLPSNTSKMSDVLYNYRVGLIDSEEYQKLTGHKPDEEK